MAYRKTAAVRMKTSTLARHSSFAFFFSARVGWGPSASRCLETTNNQKQGSDVFDRRRSVLGRQRIGCQHQRSKGQTLDCHP